MIMSMMSRLQCSGGPAERRAPAYLARLPGRAGRGKSLRLRWWSRVQAHIGETSRLPNHLSFDALLWRIAYASKCAEDEKSNHEGGSRPSRIRFSLENGDCRTKRRVNGPASTA